MAGWNKAVGYSSIEWQNFNRRRMESYLEVMLKKMVVIRRRFLYHNEVKSGKTLQKEVNGAVCAYLLKEDW